MLLWGGKLVLDTDKDLPGVPQASGQQGSNQSSAADAAGGPAMAASSGLVEFLDELGLYPEQADYVKAVFRPLLTSVVISTAVAMPTSPAPFLVSFLCKQLSVPKSLSSPLLCWLRVPQYPGDVDLTTLLPGKPASAGPPPKTGDGGSGGGAWQSQQGASGGPLGRDHAAGDRPVSSSASAQRPHVRTLRHANSLGEALLAKREQNDGLQASMIPSPVDSIGAKAAASPQELKPRPDILWHSAGCSRILPTALLHNESLDKSPPPSELPSDEEGAGGGGGGYSSRLDSKAARELEKPEESEEPLATGPPAVLRVSVTDAMGCTAGDAASQAAPPAPGRTTGSILKKLPPMEEEVPPPGPPRRRTAGSGCLKGSRAAAVAAVAEEQTANPPSPPPKRGTGSILKRDSVGVGGSPAPAEEPKGEAASPRRLSALKGSRSRRMSTESAEAECDAGADAQLKGGARLSLIKQRTLGELSCSEESKAGGEERRHKRTWSDPAVQQQAVRETRYKHLANVMISEPLPNPTPAERSALIRNVPLFRQLTDKEVGKLAMKAQVKGFDPDETIVTFGQPVHEFHVVLAGQGRVTQPVQLGTVGIGDSFGEHALVKRHLMPSTSVSSEAGDKRLVTLTLTHDDLEELGFSNKLRRRGQSEMEKAKRVMRTDTATRRPEGDKSQADHIAELAGAKVPKTEEDRIFIQAAIRENVHMRDWLQLSDKQIEAMSDLMSTLDVEANYDVCVKGDCGDSFFIVQEGLLEVLVDTGQTALSIAKCLRTGDSFGELALLYNTRRNATVRASRKSCLWTITRPQFCAVMKLKSDLRIKRYLELVNQVPVVAERMNAEERSALADTLEEVFFVKGEDVVRQGDAGNTFFIVSEGECEIRVDGEVKGKIASGGYFGERALLNHEPRAATVTVATQTATLLALDSISFDLILYKVLSDHRSDKSQEQQIGRPCSKILHHRSSVELTKSIMAKKTAREQGDVSEVPLERLTTIGILGSGTYGNVTLRFDALTGTMYALKSMSKTFIRKEKLKSMVHNEKKTMMMINSVFVVKLYRTYVCHQYYYLLLEPVLGGELFTVYSDHSSFFGSEVHAKFYSCCCAIGLHHIHALRIIYRDLKMENVLLHTNGYAVLTDMGCAKVVVGKTYTVCGTTDYFAPETLKRVGHNRAVDWWALGVLIFTMMAGRSPFDADDVLQIYKNINKGFKADSFPLEFSTPVIDVIKALCRKKPEERLGMASVVDDFRQHPFFADLDWDAVEKREWKVPFRPPGIDLQEIRSRQPVPEARPTQNWSQFIKECGEEEDDSSDSDF